MDVTITSRSSVAHEAEIQVTPEELQPHFDRAYERYRKKVELKGFRKGKAPMEMIRRLYGPAIEHETLEDAAGDFYRRAMEERSIQPVGRPSLVDMDFKPGERFWFRITYEVRPEVTLGAYTGIAAEKPVHVITEEDVASELEHLRRIHSTLHEVAHAADAEHVVTADVQELDDTGTALIGRKSAGQRFLLSDTSLAPQIREALAGAETGATYRAHIDAGTEEKPRTLHLAMQVTKVERVQLPEVDSAFISSITGGKLSSPEEFTAGVRKDLEEYWSEVSERKVRDAIADEIVRRHEFEVPDAMVDAILDSFLEEIRHRSRTKELPRGFDEQKFRTDQRAAAVWQARWILLKEAIAVKEGLTVTDEDLERLSAAEAGRTGMPQEKVLAYYRQSPSLKERLLSDKVSALLRQSAAVREVAGQAQDRVRR